MHDIAITNHGIAKLLSNLHPSKAACLKQKILKELAHNISPILLIGALHTFHPFTRKSLKYCPENYKSISLACISNMQLRQSSWRSCTQTQYPVSHLTRFSKKHHVKYNFQSLLMMSQKYGKFSTYRCFNYGLFYSF